MHHHHFMASEFKISVPEESVSLLKRKLESTRLPDELDEAGWDYGVPLSDVRRLVARWKDGYDWRKYEKELNDELPQFTRDIEVEGHGVLNVHYVHKESWAKGAIPLLFVHGWPGSFIEVRKILPILTAVEEDQPSFHVVALSLPGYGFSEGARKKGFDLKQYAEVGHKLMLALGYDEYVAQGGDWGAAITQVMAGAYGGSHVKAFHTNLPLALPPPDVDPSRYTPEEVAGLERAQWFQTKGRGYLIEQVTQPQTLGYSLSDSPVGLLAWIYEKLVTWTDAYHWQDDEVLTWISIYWFSRAGPAASSRIYYEATDCSTLLVALPKTTVPYGISFFPKELASAPLSWLSDRNVIFHARHEKGGHFAAHEVPELLAGDLRKMFGKGGPAYGVVKRKDGYA
ncbi:hypothetical protein E1B28_002922 [Marasmius oreades]|uniref:Epoxide hydrolase N-terminal domain-containing protein n=1 Tax=Marasmius oreades TaxID=181124 RepID=A0A9P7RLC3_9AGAR|nr:uncharacterized protein E1B28_002922 [Marasmius oreades]KAG7085356.1 hypothetical protein E1B28_002922 [Marasmius oreades]